VKASDVERPFGSSVDPLHGLRDASGLKLSTGIVGYPVIVNARAVLVDTLEKVIALIDQYAKATPESAEFHDWYRKHIAYRLKVCRETEDEVAIEAELKAGQIEMLIEQTNDDMKLIIWLNTESTEKPWDQVDPKDAIRVDDFPFISPEDKEEGAFRERARVLAYTTWDHRGALDKPITHEEMLKYDAKPKLRAALDHLVNARLSIEQLEKLRALANELNAADTEGRAEIKRRIKAQADAFRQSQAKPLAAAAKP